MTAPSSIAFYGFLGTGNLGNDASLETALAWFRSHHPQIELRCITLHSSDARARYGLPVIPLTSPVAERLPGPLGKLAGRVADIPRSLWLAGTADIIVIPGMGVLEETLGVKPWGFPAWMYLLQTGCRLRRRPFVLISIGAELARNPFTRRIFASIARNATQVSYRDDYSREAMVASGASLRGDVVPDLAFAHPAPLGPKPEPGRVVVGVMAYHGRDDDPVAGRHIHQRYVQQMAHAIAALRSAGDDVILVGGDQVDTAVAHEIQRLATGGPGVALVVPDRPGTVTVREISSFDELSRVMSSAEVVVASRFHNLICALRQARPTVSVSYAPKGGVLMKRVGLEDYDQFIDDLDPSLLVAQVRRARDHREALSETISQRTRDFAREVHELLDSLGRDLGLSAPDRPRSRPSEPPDPVIPDPTVRSGSS